MKEGTKSIYLRVPGELKLRIEMEAFKQGRSVNNLITYILNEYIQEQERKK